MVESKKYDLNIIFQALSDPTRRSMLRRISEGEKSVTEISKPFRKISLAAVSKHLKVLERAKLIHRRKEGSFLLITINGEALKTAEEWMIYYRQYWDSRLNKMKKILEDQENEQ